jgi:hypothetical protein
MKQLGRRETAEMAHQGMSLSLNVAGMYRRNKGLS